MIIFDGYSLAQEKEKLLKQKVDFLVHRGERLMIAAILFVEDAGSALYTQLKREAASRVGIEYQVFSFSVHDSNYLISSKLDELNNDSSITGIIIQKPWRKTWLDVKKDRGEVVAKSDFDAWWLDLVKKIDEKKDVDGLHPSTLAAIKYGNWKEQGKVLPATAKAVLEILESIPPETEDSRAFDSQRFLQQSKITIIGTSELLGRPLFYELKKRGCEVEMIGSKELKEKNEHGNKLLDSDIIVSATGRSKLVTGGMVKDGVVLIDVGEPKPDIDFVSVVPKARFITPVPGGVGPMTVACLLENCVLLANSQA